MAAFNKLPSGYWRVQVRRKRKYASRTFRLKSDAERWALEAERVIATGKGVDAPQVDRRTTFGDLIRQHITDMAEVGGAAQKQGQIPRENSGEPGYGSSC